MIEEVFGIFSLISLVYYSQRLPEIAEGINQYLKARKEWLPLNERGKTLRPLPDLSEYVRSYDGVFNSQGQVIRLPFLPQHFLEDVRDYQAGRLLFKPED